MADRFHFNPATGLTGRCEATQQCPFGQSSEQHGATQEEARANFERHMTPELFSNTTSKSSAENGADENMAAVAAEEKRWTKKPMALSYRGPNDYRRGHVRDEPNSILEKLRGVPDYDLRNYNKRVEELAESDLPREEQERLIQEERLNYIQSLNALLDRRETWAKKTRASRAYFSEQLRAYFRPDETDREEQASAQHLVQRDREAVLGFAEALFKAPPYTRVHFTNPLRRF